ncbi:RagB/SusD family nutrient uptake outer membrane protein [Dysgonomonas sp. 25]|uniref:RagB/SusD family nutrient uptake outer membrane protein n=1 Tax=Dysgonomonas sp. 25 TaxID=2302933 RepID=UPI0013D12C6A|nr:RagB/SusD family nutrient uptake outer membrane protein [Dysgonomonas sp. 25]NDV67982.1 RagB/SusD family nutrient uptake outer membrane protein [Dysgonomonas sp. 25]
MKKIIYSLIVTVSLAFFACDFDTKVTDRLEEGKVWNNEKLVVAALANLYDNLQVEQNPSYFDGWDVWNHNLITTSDEGTGAYQAGDLGTGDVARANFNDEWFGYWKDGYDRIRSCNIFMYKLENASIDESLKAAYMAEARFLRAFQYFSLAKRYGGVPLITEVQEYKGISDLAQLQVPRDKEEVIWSFIIDEIDEIAADLPVRRDDIYRTRITRSGAFALQSRAALYAGSIAKYGTVQLGGIVGVDPGRANYFWGKCVDASDSVLVLGQHSLYQVYADKTENFQKMFLEKRGNSEYIFWKEFSAPLKGHSFDLLTVPFSFTQNGYGCGVTPTLDLIEAFEYTDGTPGTLKLVDGGGNLIKYNHPLDLFANKDPRLRATFYLPYDDCRGGVIEIRRGIYDESFIGNARFVTSGNPDAIYEPIPGGTRMRIFGKDGLWDTGDVGKTGFYEKKFADESLTDIRGEMSDVAWPIFRLAEIYLNKAEASFELGQAGNAQTALNMVRNRAGIRALTVGEVTIDRIRNERRVELAYENHRHWDLKRWRIAHTVLADFPTNALYPWYVWQDGKFVFTTGKAPKPNKVFQVKNYYIKITDTDMGSNPKLGPNNPGF